MKVSPNWLDMPDELMVSIFQRLPTVEVLKSTRKVCKTWWRICKYPAMWKVINMLKRPADGWFWDYGLKALTKEPVDLSCGELIDISIQGFCTDELLDHIVLQLSLAVKKVPQLEELHLVYTYIELQDLEVIGRNCPQLKSFKMSGMFGSIDKVHALAIADNMPELRHLELCDIAMTNDGLETILNGCSHLQSLCLRKCLKFYLDVHLGRLCTEQIKDFKHESFDAQLDKKL